MQTPIFLKASDWIQENMDATTVDHKTKSLFEVAQANLERVISDAMQSCEEVAQIVKGIILGEKKEGKYSNLYQFVSKLHLHSWKITFSC